MGGPSRGAFTARRLDLARFTVQELEEAVAFFDCERLRGDYVGLLVDLRSELERRRRAEGRI